MAENTTEVKVNQAVLVGLNSPALDREETATERSMEELSLIHISLVSAERLGRLKIHTQRILEEIGRELAAGSIAADPFWRGPEKNACLYCDYAAACHFEEGRGGDCRRYLPNLDGKAFWASIEGRSDPGQAAPPGGGRG